MKKKIIISIIAIIIILFFCWNGKIEFVQSKVRTNLFLIKNPPKNDSLLKKEITLFLIKTHSKNDSVPKLFYRYSWNTKYFLDHEEDPGGFSSEELINYPEDNIANFIISKCENDKTKLVGELRFYNEWGDHYKPDTIIYKCD